MEHSKQLLEAGQPVDKARKALIMLHGRGASSHDILSIHPQLSLKDFYVVAPQATNLTWYPYSFLAPVAQNEPWLSSALHLLRDIVHDIESHGISSDKIYFLGFSQGACLTLEFVTRNARRWGGAIAFTGGLIGDKLNTTNYSGDFAGTTIFIGNSDNDPHVPSSRTQESTDTLKKMGAMVDYRIYKGMGHTINEDEISAARRILT